MGEIAKAVFSGPGAVIIQLMLLAVVTWIAGYFASAVGKGQFTNLINVASVFVGLALVIGTILEALGKAAQVMGF